jgi:hypothetical protein
MRSVGFNATRAPARGHVVHVLTADWAYAMVGAATLVIFGAAAFAVSWVWPILIALTLVLIADAGIISFFARRRGILFALAIAPLHWAAQVTSAAGLTAGWILRNMIGDPAPDATTQAFAEVGVTMWPPVPKR